MKTIISIILFCLFTTMGFCETDTQIKKTIYNKNGKVIVSYDAAGDMTIHFEKNATFLYDGCGNCTVCDQCYYNSPYNNYLHSDMHNKLSMWRSKTQMYRRQTHILKINTGFSK